MATTEVIHFEKITARARSPTQSSKNSFVLRSAHNYNVLPAHWQLVETDLLIYLPVEVYARITAISKNDLHVKPMIFDWNYKDDIAILVYNFTDVITTIKNGDVVAKMYCEYSMQSSIQKYDELARKYDDSASLRRHSI